MNWRAESTGNPLPLSRPATQSAEIMAKVDPPCGFSAAAAVLKVEKWPLTWSVIVVGISHTRIPTAP
jgi:hypothetical protein